MNLDELRPILAGYRAQVSAAWSPATAHESYEGKAGDPAGQCGVTSAWLQRRLAEDHGIASWFCVGSVWIKYSWSPQHCWLELDGPDRVILDLTGCQFGEPLAEITCDAYLTIWNRDRVLYSSLEMRSAATPVDARRRLALLEAAMS